MVVVVVVVVVVEVVVAAAAVVDEWQAARRVTCDRNSQPSWTTSQPQWIGVTVWNGEMWMLRRANHMHSDGASLGGAQTRPRRAVAVGRAAAHGVQKSQTTSPRPSPSMAACRCGVRRGE